MDQLLDTHIMLWYIGTHRLLSANAKSAIERQGVNNFVSIASIWELAIKSSLNKIELIASLPELTKKIKNNGFRILPISIGDTLCLSTLPLHHRDPFDRMLIAQAINNDFALITADHEITKYNLTVIR